MFLCTAPQSIPSDNEIYLPTNFLVLEVCHGQSEQKGNSAKIRQGLVMVPYHFTFTQ